MRTIEFTDKQNQAVAELESILETTAIKDDSQAMLHIEKFNNRVAKVLNSVGLLWSLAVSVYNNRKVYQIIIEK